MDKFFLKLIVIWCIVIFTQKSIIAYTAYTKVPHSKIAIISLYTPNYVHIGMYSDLNKKPYAQKHGYDIYLYHELLDVLRKPEWSKIIAIQNHLHNYEWIYWSDADSLIMNYDIMLESLTDSKYDLIISKDYNGINTGSFLIRNTVWAHQLLKDIYSQKKFLNHPWCEQKALMYLIDSNPSLLSKIKIIPQRKLNSYVNIDKQDSKYSEGDFVVHFPGVVKELKRELIKNYYFKARIIDLLKRDKIPYAFINFINLKM